MAKTSKKKVVSKTISPSSKKVLKKKSVTKSPKKVISRKQKRQIPWIGIIGILIVLIGTMLLLFPPQLAVKKPTPVVTPTITKEQYSYPKRIKIADLNIDVAVVEGGFVNNDWILSDTEALYVPTSGKVNEGFNTIVYAHKRPGLFGSLANIAKDATIVVIDHSGKEYTYKVFAKEHVLPNSVDSLQTYVPNTLTLFTCDGIFDTSRFIVKAKQVK